MQRTRRVVRYRRGQSVRQFERIPGRRAEALDATVYAFAARSACPVQLDARAAELAQSRPPVGRRCTGRRSWGGGRLLSAWHESRRYGAAASGHSD